MMADILDVMEEESFMKENGCRRRINEVEE
jgi:hypothetical protein